MPPPSFKGQPVFRYRGIGGMFAQIEERKNRPPLLTILDGVETVVFEQAVQLRGATSVPSVTEGRSRLPMVLAYAGAASHPAGDQAPISWVNGEGKGRLRLMQSRRRVLLLPLIGLRASPHESIAPRAGTRGPSRSSDLWLIATAWCLPAGFTARSISELTGISGRTVWKWMQDMERTGYIAENPQAHQKSYVLRWSQREALAHLVVERWAEWRRGTGTRPLRPTYFHFTANEDWKRIQPIIRNHDLCCFPSGVTVLEGGPECGPKSWITPGGLLPELNLYTTVSSQKPLTQLINLVLCTERKREDDSSLCVLADDHPAIQLYQRRSRIPLSNPWPWGFAALDALDHHDPRVPQAAREAWREWVENQDLVTFQHARIEQDLLS